MPLALIEPARVLVRQVKEWGEILLGFEARNRFQLLAEDGRVLGSAAEEGGGIGMMVARNLLGPMRAATIHVYDGEGREVLCGKKPFRWYFHRMEILEGTRKLGAIQRRFALFHRLFVIENAAGEEVLRVESKWFHLWTFDVVTPAGERAGAIKKEWGGLLREMFSDADTFGVEFPGSGAGEDIRKILLVATFLVDFTCFENNTRH